MHITVNKTTKNNSVRKDKISGTHINLGAGYGAEFWWMIHFHGKDKNGLSAQIEVQLSDKECEKFIKDLENKISEFKKYIKDKEK
ncbi:MAG: hypothetical protein AABY15_03105 [Nanoarchaeota archaeon]